MVDAAYEPAGSLSAWADRLHVALREVLLEDATQIHMICHDASGVVTDAPFSASNAPAPVRDVKALFDAHGGIDELRGACYPPTIVVTHSHLRARANRRTREMLRSFRDRTGIVDALGILIHPRPGTIVALQAFASHEVALASADRRRLTWFGLHVEAALRMRLRPESLRAVVGPTGRIEHLAGDAPTAEQLAGAVRAVQEARRTWRSGGDALAHWPALAAGELSVVERRIGTRPHYHFFDNPPHRQPLSALTDGEQDAVAAIARAPSIKAAAYELGTSASALSHRLAGAASKLGLCTTMDLVRLAAVLARDPRARFEHIALTPSEEDVLELVGRGLSNAEIARIRARSARTIANQVASLLRKTGAPNRRALDALAVTRQTTRPDHEPAMA